MQHPNRRRGVFSNDQIRGFKLIIIYKFYFFIRISGEYVFVNQCFHYFFIGFIIVVHLVLYICVCVCVCVCVLVYARVCVRACACVFWQHFFIDTYLIEHNRHFLSTYFFVNPFELPYWSCDIRRELVDKSFIIRYFPSTFRPTLGHQQGRMYYKSDVTFVCTLLLCRNERLHCCIV